MKKERRAAVRSPWLPGPPSSVLAAAAVAAKIGKRINRSESEAGTDFVAVVLRVIKKVGSFSPVILKKLIKHKSYSFKKSYRCEK